MPWPSDHRARRVLATIVTLVSVVWVLFLLARAWPMLAAHAHEIRLPLLLIGLMFSVASAYLTFKAFATLTRAIGIASLPTSHLAHLYFTGQLLKHLPGRIWGIGYQWAAGRSAGSLGDWVLVNLLHMLLAIYFALWAAWVAYATSKGAGCSALALSSGLVAYPLGWKLAASSVLQGFFARMTGRMAQMGKGLQMLASTSLLARLQIFLWFCGSWLLFYAAWIAFGLAYPSIGARGGTTLCAYYMLAWFVGYVSLLTPSGLGVRELVFAWIAHGFGADVIALMAIVGRTSLLTVDILLGLLFAPFSPRSVDR